MSYGIFPQQRKDPNFMDAYHNFMKKYQEEYLNNSDELPYNCELRSPENVFLIYMPNDNMKGALLEQLMNTIVYVETQEVKDSSTHLSTFLHFQDSSDAYRKQYFDNFPVDKPIVYESIISKHGKRHSWSATSSFRVFNPRCVFRLQPEHYHYFLPFFKDFLPFRKLYEEYTQKIFVSTRLPENPLS